MLARILVPMDDSEIAERALEYALEHHPDAEVTVLHAVGGPTVMMGEATAISLADDPEEAAGEIAEPVLERARAVAADHDREIDTVVALGHPVRPIIERADEYDAIVMGAHGEHSSDVAHQWLVGNVAEKVFRRSPVPVVSVR